MKIILLAKVANLGNKNDVVDVAPGYACNYLFPRKLAVLLNESTLKMRNSSIARATAENEHLLATLNETAAKIKALDCKFVLKTTGESKTFGHVNEEMIVKKLASDYGIEISKHCFHEHLKLGIGEHQIDLKLHPKVTCVLHVSVTESKNE